MENDEVIKEISKDEAIKKLNKKYGRDKIKLEKTDNEPELKEVLKCYNCNQFVNPNYRVCSRCLTDNYLIITGA